MKQIQWFPGHMVKALKEIEQRLKLIDLVIELIDARAPLSSRNPVISSLIQQKPAMVLLTKKDLADEKKTKAWLSYFQEKNITAYAIDMAHFDFGLIQRQAKMVLKDKFAKEAAKGIRPRPIRALIVGIPNVGKSTFINRLAKRKAAKVGNQPGITRAQQWIKVEEDFELLDTPGVLWPNFEDKATGIKLALLGTIKSTILPKEVLTLHLLRFLTRDYTQTLEERYGGTYPLVHDEITMQEVLQSIGLKRGMLVQQGLVDTSQVMDLLLKEFADGKMGRFTLESVGDVSWQT
jgi:ribosome biogenesis GTPase A